MERKRLKKRDSIPLREKLKREVIMKMKDMGMWKEELLSEIPTYWELYSNFVIFNSQFFLNDCWYNAALWKCVSELFSGKNIALRGKVKNDCFRSPSAKLVFGDSPWVNFIDNRIHYTWNLESTMFCSGNVSERHRVANFDCRDKVVVDMFAGIGYFVLPFLVHAKAKKVIACEWNPVSLQGLKKNLLKNNVEDKCMVIEGDVRINCPRNVADHINMGLIPSCEQYWPTAAEILKPSGGIVHVHGNVTTISNTQTDKTLLCNLCSKLLNDISIGISQLMDIGSFKLNISTESEVKIEILPNQRINWKNENWFVWVVHIVHSFCELLFKVKKIKWIVEPLFLHRVKSYAPHIDHLVVDISCTSAQ